MPVLIIKYTKLILNIVHEIKKTYCWIVNFNCLAWSFSSIVRCWAFQTLFDCLINTLVDVSLIHQRAASGAVCLIVL